MPSLPPWIPNAGSTCPGRPADQAGLRVGEDVVVVGYDDIWPSEFSSPALTSVRLPMAEMGAAGADLLIDTVEGKITPGRRIVLSPTLIVRNSSRQQKQEGEP